MSVPRISLFMRAAEQRAAQRRDAREELIARIAMGVALVLALVGLCIGGGAL